jgi:hypothetical protein
MCQYIYDGVNEKYFYLRSRALSDDLQDFFRVLFKALCAMKLSSGEEKSNFWLNGEGNRGVRGGDTARGRFSCCLMHFAACCSPLEARCDAGLSSDRCSALIYISI